MMKCEDCGNSSARYAGSFDKILCNECCTDRLNELINEPDVRYLDEEENDE